MPEIYALYSPYPGAGKTTLAQLIYDENKDCFSSGHTCFELISFAEPMRCMISSLYEYSTGYIGEDFEELYEEHKEEIEPTLKTSIRHMMRTLGTEWGRKCIRESFWVDIAEGRIKSSCASIILFDDLRFPNEYEMLKKHGAKFIKIVRPAVAKEAEHASDGALNGYYFDLVIENTGTEWEMYDKFKEWREGQ